MGEAISTSRALSCATQVMAALPLIMRTVGGEMRRRHASELSEPQFHALMIIKHHDGTSLSFVASRLSTGLSSTSKLIDGLVERGLLARESSREDRRQILLSLTPQGEEILGRFHQETITYLAGLLAPLTDGDFNIVMHAMDILTRTFLPMNQRMRGASRQGAEE